MHMSKKMIPQEDYEKVLKENKLLQRQIAKERKLVFRQGYSKGRLDERNSLSFSQSP